MANLNVGPPLAVSLALTLLAELARYDEEYGPIPLDQNIATRFRDTPAATRTIAYLKRLLEDEI